jgi:hypothetical protein
MDWTLFARYAAPVVALFVGVALDRLFERRPKLAAYLGHASAIWVQPANAARFLVNTHSVVVRNSGRKPATNVRLGHFQLPDFSVFPSISHQVVDLPDGSREILFPTLIPKEQVTVTYLYFPPVLWNNVNSTIRSDEGFARILNVLPTPQAPAWARRLAYVVLGIGSATILYAIGQVVSYVWRRFIAS